MLMADFPYSELVDIDDPELVMIICLKAIFDVIDDINQKMDFALIYLKNNI